MRTKTTVRLLCALLACCFTVLASCGVALPEKSAGVADNAQNADNGKNEALNPENNYSEQLASGNVGASDEATGEYNEGKVLVKYDGEFTENVLENLDFISAEPLYAGSKWHTVTLGESMNTAKAVKYLRELGCFDEVDYDYIMKSDGTVDISGNTYAEDLTYLDTLGVKKGWENNANNKKNPGGSPDVIIAIIDTGVDYNHIDLRNNIWVNSAEIANNGIDDDGNGYVDDIHGWDCVGDDNDPMDDNGHGTHVAGIAAAENNKMGTVGIAYNCKIMVLKAGNSSGYFNNSDIAEAVQYAYMNGASVINMSFGGNMLSRAAEESLENAYNQCILVAAAGNEGECNSGCMGHPSNTGVYPAALPYVIGVMSCNANGTYKSDFSNYDHDPYNSVEYEVYACGESITSSWPNNKYAVLSGTSMATPTVSGIAAVLRSTYPDRDVYSNKYIQSQIINTGTKIIAKQSQYLANLYEALTVIPKPNVKLYDYYFFDNVEYSENNNGNGVIDAGETIRIAIELQNRAGVASNVIAKIDTIRNNDPSLTDPYITILRDTVNLSDIGTYSVRDCGKIFSEDDIYGTEENILVGTTIYFEILVSNDCPNQYISDINLSFSYINALDDEDQAVYTGSDTLSINVNKGYHLYGVIEEDTVFTNDRLYIVSSNVVIPEGVTVTFEAGCQIQFYDDRTYYDSPMITVFGTLNLNGTSDNMISIMPHEQYLKYGCVIENRGYVYADYIHATNFVIYHPVNYITSENHSGDTHDFRETLVTNSILLHQDGNIYVLDGTTVNNFADYTRILPLDCCLYPDAKVTYKNNYVEVFSTFSDFCPYISEGNFIFAYGDAHVTIGAIESFTNNVAFSKCRDDVWSSSHSYAHFYGEVANNYFLSEDYNDPKDCLEITFEEGCVITNNAFSNGYKMYVDQVIENFYDNSGNALFNINSTLKDITQVYPHIVSVEIFNADGESVNKIGHEQITVRVTFNRKMNIDQGVTVYFGSIAPYSDYKIEGGFVSDTVWEGTYFLKAFIENGLNKMVVKNAVDASDKVIYGKYQLHEFTIDTTAAMSMNLQANSTDKGIELTFAQDDYDTLLGYNIYRAESKDGNYVKLNPAILLPADSTFLDENAEPGKTYWYTYTVVLTDFTESNPAGKVVATAKDTMAPNMYHTPVNQGYLNNNLVISCTASDNVAISSVVLYYRAVGASAWKTLNMSKQNDKYSATVFGSELTLAGMEYYIVAYDTNNSVSKGSESSPYKVTVKDASSISRKGDVDGDGTVTTKDALMLMQCINGDLIMTDDEFRRADLDGNGTLNSSEALRILQYINGNVTDLEM